MKVVKYIQIILIITLVLFSISYTTIYATTLQGVIDGAETFIQGGSDVDTIDNENLKNLSNIIYNTLLVVGIIVAVLIGAIIAIKFMIGSVEEKSKIKEALVPYFAGCAVIFGAFIIWRLVITILRAAA